ncbi:MAG: polyribonucleotide nucleotidyltransferase, partial [Patescibacteria group bacterium]
MQTKTYETEYCGKKLKVEISDLADQANGSVLVRYGETAVFATAVMAKNKKEGMSFFPLTVDYEEKFYAAGRIMGGRFMKREGRPSEEAILTARIIDRTIRPMFDKRLRNELQVIVMALSIDGKNDPDVPAIIAASLALGISDIPWGGPVGAVRVGQIDGKFVFNPTYEEREKTNMDMVVCGKDGRVNMIEAGAKEVLEEIATKGVEEALKEVAKVEDFQKNVIKEIGKEKIKIEIKDKPKELVELFNKNILPKLEAVLYTSAQSGQDRKKPDVESTEKEWADLIKESGKEELLSFANEIFEDSVDELVHSKVIDAPKGQEKRQDGRRTDEIRSLHASVGLLPVLHGSAVFYRGNTHILSAVTLGGPQDAQLIEGMEIQTTKHFMHHYNFPPFS